MRISAIVVLFAALTAHQADGQGTKAVEPMVVYFGDSITEGWIDAVLRPHEAYPALTDSLLHAGGIRCISVNAGRAGETSEDAMDRIDHDVLALHPSVVVIAFGSNDYYIHGYATRPRVDISAFRRNLVLMCRLCAGIGARALLLGLPPCIEERFAQYSPARLYVPYGGAAALNRSYDAAIRVAASEAGVPYISNEFASDEEIRLAIGFDGVHLSLSGHHQAAARIAPVVDSLLAASPVNPPADATDVTVFPQPFRSDRDTHLFIRISLANTAEIAVRLVDQVGRVVAHTAAVDLSAGERYIHFRPTDVNGTTLAAGAYFLQILVNSETLHQHPLIIQ